MLTYSSSAYINLSTSHQAYHNTTKIHKIQKINHLKLPLSFTIYANIATQTDCKRDEVESGGGGERLRITNTRALEDYLKWNLIQWSSFDTHPTIRLFICHCMFMKPIQISYNGQINNIYFGL